MRRKTSLILEAVQETARGLHAAGVMDRVTLREFDRLSLPHVEPLRPEDIRHIREEGRVSQAVFAALLNTSVSTVQKWAEETNRHGAEITTLGAYARDRLSRSVTWGCTRLFGCEKGIRCHVALLTQVERDGLLAYRLTTST